MEKIKVGRNYNAYSADSSSKDETLESPTYNYYDFIDEEWDDEDIVEEYFSKKKSRVRKQNKSVEKNINKYNEEW